MESLVTTLEIAYFILAFYLQYMDATDVKDPQWNIGNPMVISAEHPHDDHLPFYPYTNISAPSMLRLQDNDTIRGAEVCNDKETENTMCVRGQGECFVYVLEYGRKPACHCHRRYTGIRCEELNFDLLFPSTERVFYSGLIVIVVVGVLIAIIHVGIIVLCYRRRQNRVNRERLLRSNVLVPDSHSTHIVEGLRLDWNKKYLVGGSSTQGIELKPTSV